MYQLRTLGGLSIRGPDGAEVLSGAGAQRRPLAVLAQLAIAGDRGVLRDKLLAAFWPDSDDDKARRVLTQLVYALRRDLGADDVLIGTTELRLNTDVMRSDVAAYTAALDARAWRRAVELYTGPFLDGVRVHDAPAFERWVDEERGRLASRYHRALRTLATDAESVGDTAGAVEWYRRLAAIDPLDSGTALSLMRALAASGDRSSALRHARVHESLLQSELEAAPDPAITAYAAALRDASTTLPTPPRSPQIASRPGLAMTRPPAGGDPATPPAAPGGDASADYQPAGQGAAQPAGDPAAHANERPAERPVQPAASPATASPDDPAVRSGARRLIPRVRTGEHPLAGVAALAAAAGPPGRARRLGPAAVLGVSLAVVGAAVTATVLLSSRHRVLTPTRVLVAPFVNNTGDTTLDAVGRMTADWVTQRLDETGLVDVVDTRTAMLTPRGATITPLVAATPGGVRTLAQETGAGTVVWGSFYRDGDSLRFQANVSDAVAGRILKTVDPVSGPVKAPLVAVDRLREHITGALAVLYNPRLSAWIERTTAPPTYAAYEEFITGIDLHVHGDRRAAIAHYLRAGALDSTYAQPLLWAGDAYLTLHEYARADSLVTALAGRRARLAPFDRLLLDNTAAEVRGDWPSALRTAREMDAVASGPETSLDIGYYELALDHPHRALDALRHLDANRGWLQGWDGYWQFPAAAEHLLGQHDAELAVTRDGLAHFPDSWRCLAADVRALAALGRVDDVAARVDEGVVLAPSDTMNAGRLMVLAADEFRAHGHADGATRFYLRAASWYAAPPAGTLLSATDRIWQAAALDAADRTAAAAAIWRTLAADTSADIDALGALGVEAAAGGDRAAALARDRQLAAIHRPYLYGRPAYQRSRIAARLGDRARAVQLLRAAFAEGRPYDLALHTDGALASLVGYPPFDAILRPAD